VLDVCAAPGAKTTHLAALMGNQGEVVAAEVHPGRAKALQDLCARMGAAASTFSMPTPGSCPPACPHSTGSWSTRRAAASAPCNRGLTSVAGARGEIDALADKQLQLLRAGAEKLQPGGTLVYSVCTISRRRARA